MKENKIFLKTGRELIGLFADDIVYVSADNNYCNIYVKGKKNPIVSSNTFNELCDNLQDVLIKVRRGKAVNIHYVTKVADGEVTVRHVDVDVSIAFSESGYRTFMKKVHILGSH